MVFFSHDNGHVGQDFHEHVRKNSLIDNIRRKRDILDFKFFVNNGSVVVKCKKKFTF